MVLTNLDLCRPSLYKLSGCEFDEINELKRGNALIVDKVGNYKIEEFIEPKENKACSFWGISSI